uniref:Putative conserved secreted protein n=1 Tax=Culex tarsalis TaxID=7177 RepID=A0A1Q3FMV7_CULTA
MKFPGKFLFCFMFSLLYVQFSAAADPEVKPKFITCDFDVDLHLDKNPNNIKYLPEECRNLNDADKALLMQEALNFKQFNTKLQSYEKGLGLDTDDSIYKDWDFRDELYANASLHLCGNGTVTLEEYVGCMMEKRDEMVEKIDERIAEQRAERQ